jgi:hypothetical protein
LILGALIGAVVTRAVDWGFQRNRRLRAMKSPLVVHVETDPAIIWAGAPPWVGAGFLVPPNADVSLPPTQHCPGWRTWIRNLGGVDESITQVRVTLSAKEDLNVVVDGLRAHVHSRKPVPPWRHVICAVGGADITPKRAEIALDDFAQPVIQWLNEGCEAVSAPTFSLSGSESEMLQFWARSRSEWIEWTAELFLIVDGQRKVIPIDDTGDRFITTGAEGATSQHMWAAGSWQPPL